MKIPFSMHLIKIEDNSLKVHFLSFASIQKKSRIVKDKELSRVLTNNLLNLHIKSIFWKHRRSSTSDKKQADQDRHYNSLC